MTPHPLTRTLTAAGCVTLAVILAAANGTPADIAAVVASLAAWAGWHLPAVVAQRDDFPAITARDRTAAALRHPTRRGDR